MVVLETRIDITAPPSKVWDSLIDFPAMSSWNPFIRAISGAAKPGETLSVRIEPPGQSGMTFKPTVLVAAPGRELRWAGTFLGRTMFRGEHRFQLEPITNDVTRLTHGEQFSGLLAPLIMRGKMLASTEQGFIAMNEALKRRCEAKASAP